ncbi:hypothetical protein AURDEDRAFT_176447 [Auricularia subglabra TFB-10046 SS5]|uniref:Secreted protein n=1 Tax=Auricularia subglabra (strain TFB-10046 / SS5) TaxID=717982 RepID=J0WPX9_AURST|nr:hypothetical protein AURDEDRAFT_176447 [Auricularia subglabra TFB-10046 SS5]
MPSIPARTPLVWIVCVSGCRTLAFGRSLSLVPDPIGLQWAVSPAIQHAHARLRRAARAANAAHGPPLHVTTLGSPETRRTYELRSFTKPSLSDRPRGSRIAQRPQHRSRGAEGLDALTSEALWRVL